MPEYLRALVVILGLSIPLFALLKQPWFGLPISTEDFCRRRNLWLTITILAFLAPGFWVYVFLSTVILYISSRRETNPLGLYLFVLFVLPPFSSEIKGLGQISLLFSIGPLRLLSLLILFPAWLTLRRQLGYNGFGRFWADRILVGYILYQLVLRLAGDTFTNAIREGIFYSFTDVYLPYIVASRGVRNILRFQDAIASLAVAACILGLLAVIEYGKEWLLYSSVDEALGIYFSLGGYLGRGGKGVRAMVTAGHSIALGYILCISLMLFFSLKVVMVRKASWWVASCIMSLGLIVAMSRGPWVGALAGIVTYILLSDRAFRDLLILAGVVLLLALALFLSPYQDRVIDLIPFIGTVDEGSVTYRQDLVTVSMVVIKQHILFGSPNFRAEPVMQQLIQGEGIIDPVNTYIVVALAQGLVGLTLFSGIFFAALGSLYFSWRSISRSDVYMRNLGRSIMAAMIAMMIMIATTSPILHIPTVYWMLSGFCVGYVALCRASSFKISSEPVKRPRSGSEAGALA